MPRFAANLTMPHNELPFLHRFAAEDIAQRPKDNGLQWALHNLPAGNWAGGERDTACHLDRASEFREGVHKALAHAAVLKPPQMNALAGDCTGWRERGGSRCTLVGNLRFAAQQLGERGIWLLMEPNQHGRHPRLLHRPGHQGHAHGASSHQGGPSALREQPQQSV